MHFSQWYYIINVSVFLYPGVIPGSKEARKMSSPGDLMRYNYFYIRIIINNAPSISNDNIQYEYEERTHHNEVIKTFCIFV